MKKQTVLCMLFVCMSVTLALSACAGLQSFHVKKTSDDLAKAYQNSEGVAQKAQDDFNEKNRLKDSLKKINSPAFKDFEYELGRRLDALKTHLGTIQSQRQKMSAANAELAALAYNRKKVYSDQPEYARVDEAVKQFEEALKEFNAAVANYSRESNTLADQVTQRKLFYNFDVAEFQEKIRKLVNQAQKNSNVMQQELDRTEKLVNNQDEGERRQTLIELHKKMLETAQEHNQEATELGDLSRRMADVSNGRGRISSIDPSWSEVQKLVAEFDRSTAKINDLNGSFLNLSEKTRGTR